MTKQEELAMASEAIDRYFPGAKRGLNLCHTSLGVFGIRYSRVTQKWMATGVVEFHGMPLGFNTADDAAKWVSGWVDNRILDLQKERGIIRS